MITVTIEFNSFEEAAEFLHARTNKFAEKTERKNINPGQTNISRIGAKKKDSVLAAVGMGAYPKRYEGADSPYLRLLWARNEVKFDGETFYK